MKVVCVDNGRWIGRQRYSDLVPLTIGKVYETRGGPPAQWEIICDDEIVRNFSTARFVTPEEWRGLQLKKLDV